MRYLPYLAAAGDEGSLVGLEARPRGTTAVDSLR
ncbi:hypothetical protein CGMCC3_g3194 [Colletotrichum fructicola]|nr:uncharacterized protein CGMCC3_g3194 [Colletotrichum fructicola]KAE9581102.1 hypothetical protein CGMCC3_g3194 [Colletotrichum fructicola]